MQAARCAECTLQATFVYVVVLNRGRASSWCHWMRQTCPYSASAAAPRGWEVHLNSLSFPPKFSNPHVPLQRFRAGFCALRHSPDVMWVQHHRAFDSPLVPRIIARSHWRLIGRLLPQHLCGGLYTRGHNLALSVRAGPVLRGCPWGAHTRKPRQQARPTRGSMPPFGRSES